MTEQNFSDDDIMQLINEKVEKLNKAREEIKKVVFGQDEVIDNVMITLMSGGHVLLLGVPGTAKTLLVNTTSRVMGLVPNRIQCTPDLMPADILGSEVLEEDENGKKKFRFIEGPTFAQFLLVDEINRASPRTQSALLQAMQEKSVTVAGKVHDLPRPFHVLATQNPLEQEGTYPLPEAQLDRFLMQLNVDYPDKDSEKRVAIATTKASSNLSEIFGKKAKEGEIKAKKYEDTAEQIFEPGELIQIQELVKHMPVPEKVVDAIVDLVRKGRPSDESSPDVVKDHVSWAPGTRAVQAFMLAVRARALLDGRMAPSVDDVVALAEPILQHRMNVGFRAKAENVTVQKIIKQLTNKM